MDILTTASQDYMATFSGFVNQFLSWGEWLFFGLLTINVVWLFIEYAFDQHSFVEGMSKFLKQFFVIALFYTIMLNHDWLLSLLQTAQMMGTTLTHAPIDPSSIVSQGIGLANKIIIPISKSSLLTIGVSGLLVVVLYLFTLYVFIKVAVELAETLISTTALIAIATFFLGFAALKATSQIARNTLDVILHNCVKLLGIYMVVAAANVSINHVAASIPTSLLAFDPYVWVAVVMLLFRYLALNLPSQIAKIVSGALHESQHTDVAMMALATIRSSRNSLPAMKAAGGIAVNAAALAGSTAFNLSARATKGEQSLLHAMGSTSADLAKAVGGNLADRFKNVALKLSGGVDEIVPVHGVASRMRSSARDAIAKSHSATDSQPQANFGKRKPTPQSSTTHTGNTP